jgi:hypothetical protein
MTVARILVQAPREILFKEVSLVTKLLQRAESLNQAAAELVFKTLLRTNHKIMTFWEGQRPSKEEQDRDRARQLAEKLSRGSIESRFFHTLADGLEAQINWMMDSPDPPLDGRDW